LFEDDIITYRSL